MSAQFAQAQSPEVIRNSEPATGEALPEVPVVAPGEVAGYVERARRAQVGWAALGHGGRRERLIAFKNLLLDNADGVADIVARETGKPVGEALLHDVMPVADLTAYYARRAKAILADEPVRLRYFPHKRSYLRYEPRGVVGVIAPWNFPLSTPLGDVIMALAAGNGVVVKPSEFTPLTMLRAKELLDEAGVPEDLVSVVPGFAATGQALIEAKVDMILFTGSVATGKRIAAECGKRLIPCTLELGGKDPMIVCADADLEHAAKAAAFGAFANSGQVCASVERVYVDKSVAGEFVRRVGEITRSLRQGDGRKGEVDVGAMTTPAQLDIVKAQLDDALKKGARVLAQAQGAPATETGRFFPPTVLGDVHDDMAVLRDETFGPLLPIVEVADDEEAIRRANDSVYGLNAYVFSRDRRRAERLANRLQAGTVIINDVLYTHGLPETPWGGVKHSGIGRIHGTQGLRDLCWVRHVNTERFPGPHPWYYPYKRQTFAKLLGLARAWLRRLK